MPSIVIHDGWLFILIEIFRALTIVAGASCAARLIKVIPRFKVVARRNGIQALLSFCLVLPFTSLIALAQQQAGGIASLFSPLLMGCFLMTHRYLNTAESEASD